MALARLLGRPMSAAALTAALPLAEAGLTPDLFPRAAARAGLSARLLRRRLDEIDPLTLPCVLLLKGRQACVLVEAGANTCTVIQPEAGLGTVSMPRAELAARYAGHALFARPELLSAGRPAEPSSGRGGHWFWSVILRQWPVYGEVAVAAVLINLFALASPLFVMNVYDRVVPNNAIETLWVLASGRRWSCSASTSCSRCCAAISSTPPAGWPTSSWPAPIFAQVMGLQMAARPASAGAFANDLREFESLRDFFTSASITALVDLPFLLLFIAVIWLIGGLVALVPAIAVPLVLGGRAAAAAAAEPVVRGQPARGRAEARHPGRERSTGWRRSRASAPRAGRRAPGSAWSRRAPDRPAVSRF